MAAAIPRHLLETLVNCPACAQRYTEPKVLPTCGHTICTNCLAQEWSSLLNESAETKISRLCPLKTCRKEICSSIVDHRDLPLNQTIVDLINSWSFQVEATGPCQICHQSPSFVKCSHCSLFACFECANQHRRETLTTLTNQINTLEQDYLAMNDQIDHAKENFRLQREKSLKHIQSYYQHLIDQLHQAQKIEEEKLDHQGNLYEQELNQFIDEQKIHSERIHHTIQELRTTITDWSTVEQFKHLQTKLSEIEEEIHHRNDYFHQHLPEMKLVEPHHPLNNDEFPLHQSKVNSSTTATRLPVDDLSSATTSSTHHDPIKIISSSTTSTGHRSIRKHSHHTNHYKSLNTLHDHSHASVNLNNDPRVTPTLLEDEAKINTNQILHNHHQPRSHSSMSTNLPSKTVSSSIADLSLTSSKISSTTIRLSSFQSKLDYCLLESYKKIPLSQSFDWGILAVTNTDLILLYNKDKTSLVIYDALGQENERIQWSDGDIKDLCIYRDDTIVIVGEHKQASKPIECKLYICNLSRKQLERERVVERGLNCQRIASDEEYLFYASEKGCNKSKISVFDHELQLQITFEAGVEIRSLAVDKQCCYVLGKRREREMGRYFLEKRHKNGQLIRRIDLYELNVDNMNRVIPDPISRGVIVTDGGNKKIWAIGPEGEKKAVQYRPWPWSIAFLTNDTLLVLHAGCLTFHGVNHAKLPANSSKTRTIHTNLENV